MRVPILPIVCAGMLLKMCICAKGSKRLLRAEMQRIEKILCAAANEKLSGRTILFTIAANQMEQIRVRAFKMLIILKNAIKCKRMPAGYAGIVFC